jgi:hypothetical protein
MKEYRSLLSRFANTIRDFNSIYFNPNMYNLKCACKDIDITAKCLTYSPIQEQVVVQFMLQYIYNGFTEGMPYVFKKHFT